MFGTAQVNFTINRALSIIVLSKISLSKLQPKAVLLAVLFLIIMAWMSSGSSNAALIANLVNHKIITSDKVRNAMLSVRQNFLESHFKYLHVADLFYV